jgi:hypothetical protein
MPDVVKGFLIVVVSTLLGVGLGIILALATGEAIELEAGALIGGIFGLLYGLEAGILVSYDLAGGRGWLQIVVDFTWSLPNTVFGFVFGNLIYWFFGTPSRVESKDHGWIAFSPRGSSGFGHSVLQTLGTLNLGGSGQHERMHLLQARIFGPLYLPIFAVNYVINFLIQVLFTITIGGLLYLVKVRQTPYFRPPAHSAVSGFFGWIYFANLFELWAYASGNP